MRQQYAVEIGFVVGVLALSLVGFSSLFTGGERGADAYQTLHIITSVAWLLLLLWQLILLRQRDVGRHRVVGTSIFVAGPILVASVSLLTVHSAAKDAVAGRA